MSQHMIVKILMTTQKVVRKKSLALLGHNDPCSNLSQKHDPKPMAWGLSQP
jgi:hypothetical protein